MICTVDGQNIAIQNIGPPPMNFGQMWRYEGLKKISYEYRMSCAEFIEKTQEWFRVFRIETIEDSGNSSKGEFPVYDTYEEKGFPNLEEMLTNEKELLVEIIKENDLDILHLFSCDSFGKNEQEIYSINSLDWVKVDDEISFGGIAFLIRLVGSK